MPPSAQPYSTRISNLPRFIPDPDAHRSTKIVNLPPNIIATIFREMYNGFEGCLPDVHHLRTKWVRQAVMLVHRKWAMVAANGCPWLWDHVQFSASDRRSADWEKQMLYLSRSGRLPLEIVILGAVCSKDGHAGVMPSIADLVVPHAHRLKSLRVTSDNRSGDETIASLAAIRYLMHRLQAKQMPLLEVLELRGRWSSAGHHDLPWNGPTFATPKLRQVDLDNFPVNYRSSLFKGLDSLHVDDPRLANLSDHDLLSYFLYFLKRSPKLEFLSVINNKHWDDDDNEVLPKLVAPVMRAGPPSIRTTLTSLAIRANADVLATLLLTKLRLPHLRDFDDDRDSTPCISLKALPTLASSNPLHNLRSLTLMGPGTGLARFQSSAQDGLKSLPGALKAMVNLEVLYLTCISFWFDEHIEALQDACPKLDTLYMSGCDFYSLASFVDLLLVRRTNGMKKLGDLVLLPIPSDIEEAEEEDSDEDGDEDSDEDSDEEEVKMTAAMDQALMSIGRLVKSFDYEFEGEFEG